MREIERLNGLLPAFRSDNPGVLLQQEQIYLWKISVMLAPYLYFYRQVDLKTCLILNMGIAC